MSSSVERKLTTVLCADVAGYSRLMEKNEEATLRSLKTAREIFKTKLIAHGGRLINMAGDGLISEFPSVVNAVHCAVSIQDELDRFLKDGKFDVPLKFRIGLNLGDVMVEGDDIFGDGVNIAARLEALAPAGGICISGTVYDHVKSKFPSGFDYLGEKQVKNIEGAIPVYSLQLNAARSSPQPKAYSTAKGADTPEPSDAETRLRQQVKRQARFYRRCLMMGTILVFLMVINLVTSPSHLWFFWPALPIAFTLALDAFRVFGKGHFAEAWEEKKMARIKRRQDKRRSK